MNFPYTISLSYNNIIYLYIFLYSKFFSLHLPLHLTPLFHSHILLILLLEYYGKKYITKNMGQNMGEYITKIYVEALTYISRISN